MAIRLGFFLVRDLISRFPAGFNFCSTGWGQSGLDESDFIRGQVKKAIDDLVDLRLMHGQGGVVAARGGGGAGFDQLAQAGFVGGTGGWDGELVEICD